MSIISYNHFFPDETVRTAPQHLSERQKAQARENIGAMPADQPISGDSVPSLTIGTVTTLDPGEQATASFSGSPQNLKLNLGIPRGTDGSNGKTPIKGKDYGTAADKAVLTSEILQALPKWTGGEF